MHHCVSEMCTCVHISVTKWCIVGYLMHCGICEMGLLIGYLTPTISHGSLSSVVKSRYSCYLIRESHSKDVLLLCHTDDLASHTDDIVSQPYEISTVAMSYGSITNSSVWYDVDTISLGRVTMSSVWASTLLMWWPLYTAVYVAVVHWVYVFSFGMYKLEGLCP